MLQRISRTFLNGLAEKLPPDRTIKRLGLVCCSCCQTLSKASTSQSTYPLHPYPSEPSPPPPFDVSLTGGGCTLYIWYGRGRRKGVVGRRGECSVAWPFLIGPFYLPNLSNDSFPQKAEKEEGGTSNCFIVLGNLLFFVALTRDQHAERCTQTPTNSRKLLRLRKFCPCG